MGLKEKRFWLIAFALSGLLLSVSNVQRWRTNREAIRTCGELKAQLAVATGALPSIRTTTSTSSTTSTTRLLTEKELAELPVMQGGDDGSWELRPENELRLVSEPVIRRVVLQVMPGQSRNALRDVWISCGGWQTASMHEDCRQHDCYLLDSPWLDILQRKDGRLEVTCKAGTKCRSS